MADNNELRVIVKAKELAKHTMILTSNCNRYPKKYRFSLVDKMQNKCLDIYTALFEANRTDIGDYKRDRLELQTKAITYCDELAYFIELSQKINVSGVFTKDDHPRINRYITDIAALAQSDSTDHEASLDLIAAKIAILLIELAEIDSKSSSDTSGIKKNRGVLPAMQYVSESLQRDQHPTPGGMAEACFMSDSYFRKTFTSVMGESPKNYITRMQALKAARLLSETTAPIYDIASACGFEDNSTFYRSFMRIYGVSPSDYRNHTSSKNEPIN